MAHTDLLSHTTIFSRRTISSSKKTKQTKTNKKVSSFTLSYPSQLHLRSQTCSGLKWNENTKKKKRNKNKKGWGGFGGLRGVKFKFVIPHVQVNIKMLQLVQLSCQQDRFRAGQVPPCSLLNKKGARKLAGQLARSVTRRTVSTPCIFFIYFLISPALSPPPVCPFT